MAYNADPNNNVSTDLNPDGTKKVKDDSTTTPQFTGGVGVSDPGSNGAPSSGGAVQSSSAGSSQPASSGQFVNIQKYLNANQGSGQQIGQNITNTIDNKTNDFNSNISNDAQGVQNQVDSEKQRLAAANGFQQQITNDPTQITSDPTQLASFQQLYSGATILPQLQTTFNQNSANEGSSLNDLQNTTNLANSEAGRFQLLKQSLGRPSYTQGQQSLDQLLLQSQGNGQILNNLQKSANQDITNAQNQYNTTQTNLNQGLSDIGTLGTAAQTNLQGAVTTANTGLQNTLNQRVTDTQNQQNDLQTRLLAQEKTGVFDPDVAALLGITNGQNLYNTDLSAANNAFNPALINVNNVASTQDFARANALAQLAGQQNSNYLTGTDPGTPITPGVNQATIAKNLADATSEYKGITGDQFNALRPAFADMASMTNYEGAAPNSASDVYNYINGLNALENTHPAYADAFAGNGQVGKDYQQISNWQKLYAAMNPTRVAQVNGAPIVTNPPRSVKM